jgi:hypothetical protein
MNPAPELWSERGKILPYACLDWIFPLHENVAGDPRLYFESVQSTFDRPQEGLLN